LKCEEDEVCEFGDSLAFCAERQLSEGELTDDLEEPAVSKETLESVAAIERNTLSDSLNSLDEIQPIERISSVVL